MILEPLLLKDNRPDSRVFPSRTVTADFSPSTKKETAGVNVGHTHVATLGTWPEYLVSTRFLAFIHLVSENFLTSKLQN